MITKCSSSWETPCSGWSPARRCFTASPNSRKGIFPSCALIWWGNGICCGWPSSLQIGRYMRLGRGEEKSGGRNKASLLVDALEAILAALYLDGGWPVARDFIVRVIVEPELAHMKLETSAMPVMDFKSALQEACRPEGDRSRFTPW